MDAPRYVIGIDVGIKNLGVCVFDMLTSKVCAWDNVSLVPDGGRYIPSSNVAYVRLFLREWDHYFKNAFQVVVERQMRVNMRIVESVLQAMLYDVCMIINAKAVKLHYSLSTQNYKANKQRAVEWVAEFIEKNPGAFAESNGKSVAAIFRNRVKQDDLADSLLLVLYFLDTYSNQMTTDHEEGVLV